MVFSSATINHDQPVTASAFEKALIYVAALFHGRPGFLGKVIFSISNGFFSGVEENCIPKPIDAIIKMTKVMGFMRPPLRKLIIPIIATMIPRAIRL